MRFMLRVWCWVRLAWGSRAVENSMHLMLIFPGIGISMALFWPAYEAWLAEREGGGKLIQRVMLFNLFWSTGITLGPAFSSYLYGDANPFKPFYLAGVMVILTLGTIIANSWQTSGVLKTDSASEVNEESIETLYPPQPVRTSYLNIARCANFTSWFTLGVLRRLAPKLTKEMGMVPSTFGNLMLTLGGMQTMAFLILGSGYSTRWHYRFAPMLIVQLLGSSQFPWNMAAPTYAPLDFGIRGRWCVCGFYLFQ